VTDEIPWLVVWHDVAARVRAHRTAGRSHLVTEDVVRMETVLALDAVGVRGDRLLIEYPAPQLQGGKLDLVVDAPDGAVVELKYPRDSRTGISPDTMTLGELLQDFLRVSAVPAQERWVVQLIGRRLLTYLQQVQRRHALTWTVTAGQDFLISPEALSGLPEAAGRSLGAIGRDSAVLARCLVSEPLDSELGLYAYAVAAHAGTSAGGAFPSPPVPAVETSTSSPTGGRATGARGEILDAIAAITTRSGRNTFTVLDVVAEMRRRGTRYADSTIQTMVSSHMCAQSMGPGADPHKDLERVDRGLYRRRSSGR
jgi:hypothetical protein